MKDQAMAELGPFFGGEELHQVVLDFDRIGVLGQAESAAEAADVGIDDHAGDVEGIAEDDVGGLATDAGELGEGFEGGGHLALMFFHQGLGAGDDVLRLVVIEAGVLDDGFEFSEVGVCHRCCIGVAPEEAGGDLVHRLIGALG